MRPTIEIQWPGEIFEQKRQAALLHRRQMTAGEKIRESIDRMMRKIAASSPRRKAGA